MIRVTIFNEFYHEKTEEAVKAIYPSGIHEALRQALESDEISVCTVTLDNIETGLTEEGSESKLRLRRSTPMFFCGGGICVTIWYPTKWPRAYSRPC